MLRLKNITIRFGGLTAVNDLNIEVQKGIIFGLIGPNGAGKTTVFNIVSGVYAPTSGKVLFEESDITGKKPNEINYHGIARTYQNINLFNKLTVLENVVVGCHSQTTTNIWQAILNTPHKRNEEKERNEKCHDLLKYVNLDNKAQRLASSLSYGEQRRLEIARALASEPKLLLLDEPAAGMNLTEKDELAELISQIRNDGYTIFLVEHNMKLVMNICDEICVISFGKKIAEGSPNYIQTHPEVITSYLGRGQA